MPTGHKGGPDDVRTAWQLLAGGAPAAANALIDIAENGKSEVARVQASTAILDRVGLAPPKEVTFRVQPENEGGTTQKLPPAEVVRNRLKELSNTMKGHAAEIAEEAAEQTLEDSLAGSGYSMTGDDPEIYDAELVPTEKEGWE